MKREELLRDLKQVREKEKNKKYSVGQLNVFDMVSDVIDYLECEEKPKMTNLEFYKDEICEIQKDLFDKGLCMSDSIGVAICNAYENQTGLSAFMPVLLDWLLEEYKEPIKLKQWEKDLLNELSKDWNYAERKVFWELHKKGYFKGIKDVSMKVEDILNNHIVVSDNYNFEDCK